MDTKQARIVLSSDRPVKYDQEGNLTDAWRNDRNRRKTARRVFATGAPNSTQAKKLPLRNDVMRTYMVSPKRDAWLDRLGATEGK